MKKIGLFFLWCFCFKNIFLQEKINTLSNKKFSLGESLVYNVYWSFFKIAEIKSDIDSSIYWVADKPCYKTDLTTKVSNTVRIFSAVDEIFGAYTDTILLKPTTSYRYLKEGKYTHDEVCYFDYNQNKMKITVMNQKTDRFELKDSLNIHKNILDIVSAYINLRNINFQGKKKGDFITLSFLVEHELFSVNFIVDTYEKIKVKAGKFNAIRLIPTIPSNILFNINYPIKMWLSDDENSVPIKIEMKLKFGHVTLELKEFKKLANNFISKID